MVTPRRTVLVENVVVDESHRESGVGLVLLDAARERARAAGCYQLQLSAVEGGRQRVLRGRGHAARRPHVQGLVPDAG